MRLDRVCLYASRKLFLANLTDHDPASWATSEYTAYYQQVYVSSRDFVVGLPRNTSVKCLFLYVCGAASLCRKVRC
jgi:hypothetical protein